MNCANRFVNSTRKLLLGYLNEYAVGVSRHFHFRLRKQPCNISFTDTARHFSKTPTTFLEDANNWIEEISHTKSNQIIDEFH